MSNPMEAVFSYCKNIKLLYVEDNEEARIFTLELLSRFFDDITVAKDGKEGLELFQDKDIDLIISDINMPKMGGIEMSKYIRNINKNIPIILLSAHNEANIEEAAWNVGINEYLAKPLNLTDLIQALNKLTDSKQ